MKAENIKFRAKRTDDGAWVYGDLAHVHRINTKEQAEQSGRRTEPVVRVAYCDVDEETIGQYTGFKDDNGREIYEGDIIQRESWGILKSMPVMWDGGAFCAKNDKLKIIWPLKAYCLKENDLSPFKVVGNIYDNPELLEKEHERIG